MPLPFIPVAIALGAAGLFGLGKGYSGYRDLSKAKEMDEKSRTLQDQCKKQLDSSRKSTQTSLENLGKAKADVYLTGSIAQFKKVAELLKNMPDEELKVLEHPLPIHDMLNKLNNIQVSLQEIIMDVGLALSSGALASLGAVGGVGTLAAAGTGTAIATLHGIAATNATLAWLGGGTLAAGGFGVMGGMAMIGGLAVAPVFLVGGWIIASKGEKALEQAKENRSKVTAYKTSVNGICANLALIKEATVFTIKAIAELDVLFLARVKQFQSIVLKNDDYRSYSIETKNFVKNCFVFCEKFSLIMDVKLMDEKGSFIKDSIQLIQKYMDFINNMNRI